MKPMNILKLLKRMHPACKIYDIHKEVDTDDIITVNYLVVNKDDSCKRLRVTIENK